MHPDLSQAPLGQRRSVGILVALLLLVALRVDAQGRGLGQLLALHALQVGTQIDGPVGDLNSAAGDDLRHRRRVKEHLGGPVDRVPPCDELLEARHLAHVVVEQLGHAHIKRQIYQVLAGGDVPERVLPAVLVNRDERQHAVGIRAATILGRRNIGIHIARLLQAVSALRKLRMPAVGPEVVEHADVTLHGPELVDEQHALGDGRLLVQRDHGGAVAHTPAVPDLLLAIDGHDVGPDQDIVAGLDVTLHLLPEEIETGPLQQLVIPLAVLGTLWRGAQGRALVGHRELAGDVLEGVPTDVHVVIGFAQDRLADSVGHPVDEVRLEQRGPLVAEHLDPAVGGHAPVDLADQL